MLCDSDTASVYSLPRFSLSLEGPNLMYAFYIPCVSPGRRSILSNQPKAPCVSNPFPFNRFRTLLRNGAITTPLPSIASALFPMQWGVRGWCTLSTVVARSCKFAPLFSITYRMPLPQRLYFHGFALLPGGGWVPPAHSVRSPFWSEWRLDEAR